MEKRVVFRNLWLPYLLVGPQLLITAVFFFWPAGVAVYQSFYLPDPFGLSSLYVGLDNFRFLFTDSYYLGAFKTTIISAPWWHPSPWAWPYGSPFLPTG